MESTPNVFPDPNDNFLEFHAHPKAEPHGLQGVLTAAIDNMKLANLQSQLTEQDQRRLTSASGQNAGAYLIAIPNHQSKIISNTDFPIIIQQRLGIAPPDLPIHCDCGFELDKDKEHFHNCVKLRGRSVTHRHDRIK